ncbi:MAG: SIMPL domain-containing protein [Bacteroidales bacterium]
MKTIIIILTGLFILSNSTKGQLGTPEVKDNTLLVKGTAILKQIPEIIYASVNVKSESENYSDCQNKLLAKMDKVRSSILKQNISNDLIKTNNMTINERQEYVNGKNTKTGFNGNISLIIESPYSPEISKKLLTAFTTDSLVLNYSIGFKLSEKQKSQLRQLAITKAVEDAKERAFLIARSSDIKLIKLNSIVFLDDAITYIRDNDIIKEEIRPTQEVFVAVGGNNPGRPDIDFNPKEIGIVKSIRMEWTIEENPDKN